MNLRITNYDLRADCTGREQRQQAAALQTLARDSDAPIVLVALANEGTDSQEQLIGLENEFQIGADSWVKIAPYGESLKERIARGANGKEEQQAFLQVLDKPAAEEMARRFNSPLQKLKRFVRGVEIFKHHPDLLEHAPETVTRSALANERRAVGMFAALEARDDGFYGKPIVTREGQTAIENEGLKWLSPFWWVRVTGERNGVRIAQPTELISAGLTKHPNIQGGEALANQKEKLQQEATEKAENMIREKLIAALKKCGIALANEATLTDEQLVQTVEGLVPKASVTALENEKTTLTQAKSTAEELLKSEKTLRVNAEGKVTDLTTALANERTAKVKAVLDTAIVQGRITGAERTEWETKLNAKFDETVTALANEKQKVKTEAATANLGQRKSESDEIRDANSKILALANEQMAKTHCSYTEAYSWVQQNHGALFEALVPAAKK